MEHPGGIDADDVEQNTSQQVHQYSVHHKSSIDGHTLCVRQRAGERSVGHRHVCLSEAAIVHFNCLVDTTHLFSIASPKEEMHICVTTP